MLARLLIVVCSLGCLPHHVMAQVSSLIAYRVEGDGIPQPLTTVPGNAQSGREVVLHPQRGNCLACHRLPLPDSAIFSDIAPPLDTVGQRLSEAQLRLRLVDPKRLQPHSLMPAYYTLTGLHRVDPRYRERPILDAQEVEDVVAYLRTLR